MVCAGARALAMVLFCAPLIAQAATDASTESPAPEAWSAHGQLTFVNQSHGGFRSPYQGANSLTSDSSSKETFDATLFLTGRLWRGGAIFVNPEVDQGFGLSDTVGVAGFPSGEAYKVGHSSPYARLDRLYLRQIIELGGESEHVEPGPNELAGSRLANNVTVTLGKFSVVDIFDTNAYAHDAKADFLNWSVIDAGAFDYAADAWGYTYGGAVEWTQDQWTLRAGGFALSTVPNGKELDRSFREASLVGEIEVRYHALGHPGKAKVLAFVNHGRMGSYADAVAAAQASDSIPDVSTVRRTASRSGVALNVELGLSSDLGGFLRASANDGSKEAYEFTEINRGVSGGLALKGCHWQRCDDTVGAALAVNELSAAARTYFAAGGQGLLIGDGQLPHYGSEQIVEAYYSAKVGEGVFLAANVQRINHVAYNRDRGPVSIFGVRAHAEF